MLGRPWRTTLLVTWSALRLWTSIKLYWALYGHLRQNLLWLLELGTELNPQDVCGSFQFLQRRIVHQISVKALLFRCHDLDVCHACAPPTWTREIFVPFNHKQKKEMEEGQVWAVGNFWKTWIKWRWSLSACKSSFIRSAPLPKRLFDWTCWKHAHHGSMLQGFWQHDLPLTDGRFTFNRQRWLENT